MTSQGALYRMSTRIAFCQCSHGLTEIIIPSNVHINNIAVRSKLDCIYNGVIVEMFYHVMHRLDI